MVLRRTFGSKIKVATGGCRNLHNDELHNFYPSLIIIRVIKISHYEKGRIYIMGQMRKFVQDFSKGD
jgi:hypothetical protein